MRRGEPTSLALHLQRASGVPRFNVFTAVTLSNTGVEGISPERKTFLRQQVESRILATLCVPNDTPPPWFVLAVFGDHFVLFPLALLPRLLLLLPLAFFIGGSSGRLGGIAAVNLWRRLSHDRPPGRAWPGRGTVRGWVG